MMNKSFDMITIRPMGTYDWSAGIEWSVPIPTTYQGASISLSVAAVTPKVVLLRYSPPLETWFQFSRGWQITVDVDAKREPCFGARRIRLPHIYMQSSSWLQRRTRTYH